MQLLLESDFVPWRKVGVQGAVAFKADKKDLHHTPKKASFGSLVEV